MEAKRKKERKKTIVLATKEKEEVSPHDEREKREGRKEWEGSMMFRNSMFQNWSDDYEKGKAKRQHRKRCRGCNVPKKKRSDAAKVKT